MEELKYNARAYSRLGQSGAIFGMAAVALQEKYNIQCLSADMSAPAGLDRFKRTYPSDFVNAGIAEQNMIGIAAGLASDGYRPVCVCQAIFISMRSCEMVRQYMGYMKYPIIAVGLSSGLALAFVGNSHYSIEDLSVMQSIPNLMVLSPADAGAAVKAFEKALELNLPTYIRLTQGLMTPIVYKEDYDYDPYHMTEVYGESEDDVTIFATGSMVYQSIKAAELLKEEGVNCKVIDVHCLKPLDKDSVLNVCNSKLLVSVEEHNVIGGLGFAIADVLAGQERHPRLLKLGIKDCFSSVGDYNYLLEQHRLTGQLIAEDIMNALR